MEKQQLTAEKQEKKERNTSSKELSFLDNEKKVALRIREVMGEESQASFARRCGVSEGAIRKYLLGASPSTENLISISNAANVSIEWLATGRGSKQRTIQSASLVNHGQIGAIGHGNTVNATAKEAVSMDVLSNALKIAGYDPKSAKIVMAVYELLKSGAPMQQIDNLVKLMNQ